MLDLKKINNDLNKLGIFFTGGRGVIFVEREKNNTFVVNNKLTKERHVIVQNEQMTDDNLYEKIKSCIKKMIN